MKACDDWVQIPVAPKYEINRRGVVRNIENGKIVNPWMPSDRSCDQKVYLRIKTGDREPKSVHVSSLLWLTHGTIPKRHTHSRIPVPVVVSCGNQSYCFDSCRQAGAFIAQREKLHTAKYIAVRLGKRPKEFDGWKINYLR